MMLNWFREYRAAAEARQLNRDAPEVIAHATELFQQKVVTEICNLVGEHIERAHRQYGTSAIDLKRAHFDYKRLHKEARRRNDQTTLSAMTLIIIYLRAELSGEGAAPARQAIDQFVSKYSEQIKD